MPDSGPRRFRSSEAPTVPPLLRAPGSDPPALHEHFHPILRTQRNQRLGLYAMPRHKAQIPLLTQCRQEQHTLHQRKRLTDTLPKSRAKRKVRKLRAPRLALGREALRIKAHRIRKEPRIAMSNELAH